MYARWKTYQRKGRKRYEPGVGYVRDGELVHVAVLVESRRVDGKPRQRIVRYLCSIRESDQGRAFWQSRVWQAVDTAVSELGLSDEQRSPIDDRIAEKVPKPSAGEIEANRKRLETLEAMSKTRGRSRTSR